jgi:hypothetical protein
MAVIIPSIDLLVLQVPGTASTSVADALLAIDGAYSAGPKHCTRQELATSGDVNEDDLRHTQCVCFVRNPFDLIHAEWHRCRTRWVFELDNPATVGSWSEGKRLEIKMACAKDFGDYVQWLFADAACAGQKLPLFRPYTEDADVVFKSEMMPEFEEWLRTTFSLSVKVPKVNETLGRREYWRDYSRTARQIISELFSEEIDKLGYSF